MEKLPLYKQQFNLNVALVLISSALLIFMFAATLQTWADWISSSVISTSLFMGIFQLLHRNKFYFKYDEARIEWRFIETEEPNELNISDLESVEEAWFGFWLNFEDNERIQFSTDGLWKKDRDMLFQFFAERCESQQAEFA